MKPWRLMTSLCWLAGVLLVLAPGAPAWGEGDAEFDNLLQEAVERYNRAEFSESLALLQQAQGLTEDSGRLAQVFLYLGVNHEVLGQGEKAKDAFVRGLRRDPLLHLDPARFRSSAVTLFNQTKAGLKGTVNVTGEGSGIAALFWNGELWGPLPQKRLVPVGAHRLVVRGEGGSVLLERELVVRVGQTQTIHIPLAGEPEKDHPADPGAAPATQDATRSRVAGGPPDLADANTTLSPNGSDVPLSQPAPEAPDAGREGKGEAGVTDLASGGIWWWVTGAAAAGTLGAALGLSVWAELDHQKWEELHQEGLDRGQWEDVAQSGQDKQLAANVFWGAGGVLAVTALVLYFVERPGAVAGESASARVGGARILPWWGRDRGGLLFCF